MPALAEVKEKLRYYLQRHELKKFFDYAATIIDHDSEKGRSLLLFQGRQARLRNTEIAGTAHPENLGVQKNQLTMALVEWVADLETEDLITIPDKTHPKPYNLSETERVGIQNQLTLSIEKLNLIRQQLAMETDPSRKFAYEKQVEALEKEIEQLKQKLQ